MPPASFAACCVIRSIPLLLRTPIAAAALLASASAQAETPRQALIHAAFAVTDRQAALVAVKAAEAHSVATLARLPDDREAQMTRALAVSYRAKLTNNRSDALVARALFEALVKSAPRDPEAQAAIGGWHIEGLATLGTMVARMALGARKPVGLAALDRAVVLGGNRAMFSGLAALLRAELDPADPVARTLAEAAARGSTPTPLDQIMQRNAVELLAILKSGNPAAVKARCRQLLPFGRLSN